MICAGNKLCCDRCGKQLKTLSAWEIPEGGRDPVHCDNAFRCQERQERYREIMRDVIAGLAGTRVYIPQEPYQQPPRKTYVPSDSQRELNRTQEREMARRALFSEQDKSSILGGQVERERVARAERIAKFISDCVEARA